MISIHQTSLVLSVALNAMMAYLIFTPTQTVPGDKPKESIPEVEKLPAQPPPIVTTTLGAGLPLQQTTGKVWVPFRANLLRQCPVFCWIDENFKLLDKVQKCLELSDLEVTMVQEHLAWAVAATTKLEAKHARIVDAADSDPYIYVAPHAGAQRLIYDELTTRLQRSTPGPAGTLLAAVAIQSPLLNLGNGEQKWWTETGVRKDGQAWRMLNVEFETSGSKKTLEWREYPDGAMGVRLRQFVELVSSGSK